MKRISILGLAMFVLASVSFAQSKNVDNFKSGNSKIAVFFYDPLLRLAKIDKDFQSKIYPPFGSTHQDGHWGFCSTATAVWGNDVLAFLEAQMKASH